MSRLRGVCGSRHDAGARLPDEAETDSRRKEES